MTTDQLLQAGILAAKRGDVASASRLLGKVVQTNPNSELGWLWLGHCREVPQQREYCFRRVLAINPSNVEAQHQLQLLERFTTVANVEEKIPDIPTKEASRTAIRESLELSEKPVPPRPPKKTIRAKPLRKRTNDLIWLSLGAVVFICLSVAGMFVLSRAMKPTAAPVSINPAITPVLTLVEPTQIPDYQPVFQAADCPFQVPQQSRVTCGFVTVPEDRSGDLTDTIRIAVAIYHSASSAPKPDPILYLQGGPGDQAISWSADVYESVIAPLLAERDFIVFDSRGVGYSEPNLECGEFSATYLQDLEGKIPADHRVAYYEGALLSCKNSLVSKGANLGTYISTVTAADAADLLTALEYSQANLYGISYGTRIAQLMMRNYPEVVRSAILDSVVPLETKLLSQGIDGQDNAIQTLFNDCQADPVCSASYPDLEAVYNEVFDQLNTHPLHLTVNIDETRKVERVIDGYTFRNTVVWALRIPQTIGLAPRLIYGTREGDHTSLMYSLALPVRAFDSISMGSYISVNCYEQVFAIPLEKLGETIYQMCELWGATPLLAGENEPVNSAIPALIFAGRYDSVTPPSFAHQLAGHLASSYVAEISDQGHAPSATGISDCPTQLILAFLQSPNSAPDMSCVKETQSVKFIVPYSQNTPIALEPAMVDQNQIETRVPVDWSQADFGSYNRNGFWGDIAQVAIQRAAVPESAWVSWLATNFGDNQGFDQPATPTAQHQANGLTWSLYETRFKGYPVDIAFAESNNQTIMVLLLSYNDEHDALFNNVFLPVIESTGFSR